MQDGLRILIADRNRRVREFLRRELHEHGHTVLLAGNAGDLFSFLDRGVELDLLILDPDLPCREGRLDLVGLRRAAPSLPVVLHGYSEEDSLAGPCNGPGASAAFVEKRGDTRSLMTAVKQVLDARPRPTVRRPTGPSPV